MDGRSPFLDSLEILYRIEKSRSFVKCFDLPHSILVFEEEVFSFNHYRIEYMMHVEIFVNLDNETS